MNKYNMRFTSQEVQNIILQVFNELRPKLTVRQIYYALTARGVVPKTEAGYRRICRELGIMRQNGLIPCNWIADNTRWQIKPDTDLNLQGALERWQETYRRDLWANQSDYVEIWFEKDALAGVVSPITKEYDVPLYFYRGDSSPTFLSEMAEYINSREKNVYIYYFGDSDPVRVAAAYKVRDGLIGHGADIHFERVAVTPEQIEGMNLPTRYANKPGVELDAIPAPVLRELVRGCIERHLDREALERTRRVEVVERKTLTEFSRIFILGQKSDLGDL